MLFCLMTVGFLRPLSVDGYILLIIWLVVLPPTSEPHACSNDYMDWFMRISHPFISPRAEDEGPHVSSHRRPRSPTDINPHPLSEQDHRPVSYLDCQCCYNFF